MLLEWLSRVRGRLGGSALARALRRLGLRELVLGPYERAILRRGTHRLRVAGQLVRFAVADRAELAWLDWFRRIEGPFVDRLLRALRPGEVLFDVGANVGVVSVLAAVVGRPAGVAVHAFEPQKELAERIAANARLNGCTHSIRVHALALGRQRGRLPLYPHADNPGAASLVPGAWHRAEPRWVPVERGDAFARQLGVRPAVVKIDVEGAEADVLEGMEGLLVPGGVRELFVELHVPALERLDKSESEIAGWLSERGYRSVWRRVRDTEVHHHFTR